jgi:hypothetical protein
MRARAFAYFCSYVDTVCGQPRSNGTAHLLRHGSAGSALHFLQAHDQIEIEPERG